MITQQESLLESRLEKIARIITRQRNLTVRIVGGLAFINLETREIFLPNIRVDPAAPQKVREQADKILAKLDGLLDHESAHALYTEGSLLSALKSEPEQKRKTLHALWNVAEDTWIERRMGRAFIGCGANMERLNGWLYEEIEGRWQTLDPLGRIVYVLERCFRGDHKLEDHASDPKVGALLQQLGPEVARGMRCDSTMEAFEIGKAIYAKIEQLAKEQEQQDEGDAKASAGEEGEGQGQQGKGTSEKGEKGDEPSERSKDAW